jgi:hypothetical protein
MHRAKYQDHQGMAWPCMADSNVWYFQADNSEQAQPVLQAELRFVQVDENEDGDIVAPSGDLVASALASVVLFGLVWLLIDYGWAVALRVACGLAVIAAALWTAWRAR